jgi:hypothetical protein
MVNKEFTPKLYESIFLYKKVPYQALSIIIILCFDESVSRKIDRSALFSGQWPDVAEERGEEPNQLLPEINQASYAAKSSPQECNKPSTVTPVDRKEKVLKRQTRLYVQIFMSSFMSSCIYMFRQTWNSTCTK